MKKINKKQQGFTLVEVIVVAVIVAVLAAVAIPLYMGYIKDSRINVCNNIAGSIASGAGASRQQDVANVPLIIAQSGAAGPANITFKGQNNTDNTIAIPTAYDVVITDGTVIVNYTADAANVKSKTFNW